MKSRKRTVVITLIALLLLASVGLAAATIIPSADELLIQALETLEAAGDAPAVVQVTAELPDQTLSGTFEVWAKQDAGPNGEPAMRLEVLEASQAEVVGLTVVSDGVQFWLYDPARNTVVTGRAEELAPILAEKMAEHQGQWDLPEGFDPEAADVPETPAEAVAKFLEYFTAERSGQEPVAGSEAYRLRLVPIAEQMPDEVRAAGGFVNLWLRTSDQLPLAVEYAEGTLGYGKVEATLAEINSGLDDSLFTFAIPEGAEVVEAIDLLTQLEGLDKSFEGGAVDFEALAPSYLPELTVAGDSQPIGGAVVQRYTLPGERSFVIAQGAAMPLDPPAEATSRETVTVRGLEGTLFSNDEGTRSLLAWSDGGLFFVIGGDITPEQALAVAESLQ